MTATTGLAPDPVLPGRDALLDPATVAPWLAATLGAAGPLRVDRCALVRAKYRIGESLRVAYRVDTGGRSLRVSARTFPDGTAAGAYRRALDAAAPGGDLHPVLHDAAHGAVWWTFPQDRRLRGLDALVRATPEHRGLVGPGWRGSEVVEYAPEKSATLRAHDRADATLAFVKVFAPGTVDTGALAERYRRVAAAAARAPVPVDVPTAPACSTSRDLVVLAAMPGTSWQRLEGAALRRALHRLGEGIATLHGLLGPIGGTARTGITGFGRLRPARLARSLDLIAAARPDVADRAARVRTLLGHGPPPGDPVVLLHGDCHPGNALFDGDRLALIDLDQSGTGPAAADIGSLLARLHYGTVLGEHPPGEGPELAAAFLDGYRTVRTPPPVPSLCWHAGAAMVAERAMRAVNRVVPAALDRLDDLLRFAEDTLRHGAP